MIAVTTRPVQAWDLEAFLFDGTNLSLVGGYDFRDGYGGMASGDIFACEPTVRHGIYNASDKTAKLLAMHPVLNPPPRVDVD